MLDENLDSSFDSNDEEEVKEVEEFKESIIKE